jgi:hypothetical protein
VINISRNGFLETQKNDIRLQVLGRLASQHIQNNAVGNEFHIGGVFLKRSGDSGLGLGETAKVDFGDSLANDGEWRGGAGCGSKFLVDVESRLVLLAALSETNNG